MTTWSVSFNGGDSVAQANVNQAFNRAMEAWFKNIYSNAHIEVQINFESLSPNTLANARSATTAIFANLPDGRMLAQQGVTYELLTGVDFTPNGPDMYITINQDLLDQFTYGSGRGERGTWHLETILIHEISHGLFMNGWKGTTAASQIASVWDTLIENPAGSRYDINFYGQTTYDLLGKYVGVSNYYHINDLQSMQLNSPLGPRISPDVVKTVGKFELSLAADSGLPTTLDDHIYVGTDGTKFLNTGTGFDTLNFFGNDEKVAFEIDGNHVHATSGNLTWDIYNAERAIANGTVYALDIDGPIGEIFRVYEAAFDRAPDKSGISFWTHHYESGLSLDDILNSFISSKEFTSKYGLNLSNEDFVSKIYENVLERSPDEAGLKFWTDHMDNGNLDRAGILQSFAESKENYDGTIELLQHGVEIDTNYFV